MALTTVQIRTADIGLATQVTPVVITLISSQLNINNGSKDIQRLITTATDASGVLDIGLESNGGLSDTASTYTVQVGANVYGGIVVPGSGPATLLSLLPSSTVRTVAITFTSWEGDDVPVVGLIASAKLSVDCTNLDGVLILSRQSINAPATDTLGNGAFQLERTDQLTPVTGTGEPYWTFIIGGNTYNKKIHAAGPLLGLTNALPAAINGSVSATQTALNSTLTPVIDDPTQSPTSLADDIHNLDGRTKINSRTLTANTTLDAITDDRIFANGAGGIFTVTLPLVAGRHRPYTVIKTDSAHTITIAAHAGETINGAASITLTTQWGGVDIYPLGTGTWATKTSGSGGGTSTAAFDFVAKTTATYTIVTTDSGIGADASLNNQQITLPTAVGAVQQYAVKRVDNLSGGFTCVVNTTGGQTVEGLSQVALTVQNQGYIFGSDGANWRIVAGILPNPLSVAGTILYYDGSNLAALTVGANLSITSNTLNAASATNSGGELIVQDGVTGPPVPLFSEDGSDFIYFG